MGVKAVMQTVGGFLQKNSPYILTGLGCAGVVSTAVMTGKAAVEAHETLKNHELGVGLEEHLKNKDFKQEDLKIPLKEKVQLTWKYFVPPVVMGASSVACIIGAQTVNTRRHAALASLYTLTDQTLKDYQDKVVETIGKNKAQKIQDDMAQDILNSNPVDEKHIIRTSYGDSLCFDVHSGRYFTSSMETLRRVQNDFNHELIGTMWMSLNDLYYLMGLETIKLGDELGWTADELLEFKFTPRIALNDQPCLVIDYDLTPRSLRTKMWSGM